MKSLDAHLNYLRTLKQKKGLISAGPLMNSTTADAIPCGSMLIVDFENQEAVKHWLAEEPFNQSGVYQEVEIYPYLEFIDRI